MIALVIAIPAVVGSIFVYAYMLGSLTLTTSHTNLYLDHYTIQIATGQQNPTVLSLWLGNSGSSNVVLSSLSIRDVTSGNSQGSFQIWVPVDRGLLVTVTVDIASSGFYFSAGHSYYVTVVTSQSDQFTFTNVKYP